MSIRFKEPTKEEMQQYFDSAWTHYVASLKPPRPGFSLFAATLEHQFFPPDTPENDNFRMLSTGWYHDSMWITISIPTEKKHLAEAVASYCGLKILDTFPIANAQFATFATVGMKAYEELKAVDPSWDAFPLYQSVNLFSLENSKEHPTRTGKMSPDEWFEYELSLVEKIAGDHEWSEDDEKEFEKFKEFMKFN